MSAVSPVASDAADCLPVAGHGGLGVDAVTGQHRTGDAAERLDGHIAIDELADAAEGLVDADRSRVISAHLAGCQRCRADADALVAVQQSLAAAPSVAMPEDVFARLQGVVGSEHDRRADQLDRRSAADPGRFVDGHRHPTGPYGSGSGLPSIGGRFPKPYLADHYNQTLGRRHHRARFAGGALAAALLASTVGFGGYVLSASAGTAEPPADRPVVLQQNTLGAAASAELERGDLDAYRFTRAWLCVRKVTDGRITGIRSSALDGRSGYLVFVHRNDVVHAVFVSGCESGDPQAGPSATVREN
jgi:anti-sigma factor RsiW